MKLEEIEHNLNLAAPTEGYVRTPGLHMSELYNSLYKKLDPKRFDKRDKDGKPLPYDTVRMEVGTSFEEILEPAIAARILGDRPGEFITQHDPKCPHRRTVKIGDAVCGCGAGVLYTPDHFLFNGVFRLGEFKLTWMSCRYGITDKRFDKWFTQMKAYCYHVNTPYARLYALFVNGDYTDHSPQLRAWDITFTDMELTENWNMLVRHARKEGLLPT